MRLIQLLNIIGVLGALVEIIPLNPDVSFNITLSANAEPASIECVSLINTHVEDVERTTVSWSLSTSLCSRAVMLFSIEPCLCDIVICTDIYHLNVRPYFDPIRISCTDLQCASSTL